MIEPMPPEPPAMKPPIDANETAAAHMRQEWHLPLLALDHRVWASVRPNHLARDDGPARQRLGPKPTRRIDGAPRPDEAVGGRLQMHER